MGRKFRALELLQQSRFRKEQGIEPLLSFPVFRRCPLDFCFAYLGVFNLIRY